MRLDFSYDAEGITLSVPAARGGLFGRLLRDRAPRDLEDLPASERALSLALADLRAIGDEQAGELQIAGDTIRMCHRLAAMLDSETAQILGLPPLVGMILRTDVEGSLGTPSFRLRHEWVENGQRQLPRRTGAILETSAGPRRLPLWMLEAVEVAESFTPGRDEAYHWEALARFRRALDPGVYLDSGTTAARASMTEFLKGLEVRLADRFSIAPVERPDGLDFEIVPFSGRTLELHGAEDGQVVEAQGELGGALLDAFQKRVRLQGALSAYRVGPRNYLVVDRAAVPALQIMERMQRASPEERSAFVRNPRPLITEAIEQALRAAGKLYGLSPAGEEEAIEAAAGSVLIETQEYSERVTGVRVYEKPALDGLEVTGTTWLPEYFPDPVVRTLKEMDADALQEVCSKIRDALAAGQEYVEVAGHRLPATSETLRALEVRYEARAREDMTQEAAESRSPQPAVDSTTGPLIIDTKDNFENLLWNPGRSRRAACVACEQPPGLVTPLKQHQVESLSWQIEAWCAGLPGVLNADEQGLGKTLQTIAFLRWLKLHAANPKAENRGPILVVAPTSLLETWEAEVARHLEDPGLGHLIRLYGSGIGANKRAGLRGVDTQSGEPTLDFGMMQEALVQGRAHRFWMLTTYSTLTNYQHSLAKIPFSAVVFDEIQALKNPVSLRAFAGRALWADFRIGLTGTPIENSAADIWAIMDQLCPGALGTLRQFRERYNVPDESNMRELHARLFLSQNGLPPLALRRMKETVARDLPQKTRWLHPRPMPPAQAVAYEDARLKLAEGKRGATLKMLHHIRSVSVHPALDETGVKGDFISASGRLAAAFDILRRIRERKERALVFVEHRQMQYRFVELARQELGLARIDVINGDTPIQKRQAIVDRFQRHLVEDGGFDLLVLGPRAAGVGLTLTAATHVIHLSRWWNPAVEEQCNDRIHRLGQTRPVAIHVPMAVHPGYREHSFDCLLHSLMSRKRRLASAALWPMGDTAEDAAELQRMVASAQSEAGGDPVPAAMAAMFARDRIVMPPLESDGSIRYE